MQDLFLQLLHIALGNKDKLDKVPSEKEWNLLYEYAQKQAVIGICYLGVQRLPKEQAPHLELLMRWICQTEYIKRQNTHLDKQSAIIWKKLADAGLSAAILKGQGIGLLYKAENYCIDGTSDISMYRTSGDIDIWVKGGFDTVNGFVQSTIPSNDIAYHRFHYHIFEDTEVELHHRPTLMRNLRDDRKLQRWCDSFDGNSFELTQKGFAVPPLEFNRVFILTHIYRHFLFEGIGLRQIIDYYFVLKSELLTEREKARLMQTLCSFRMCRFAAGIMWVLQEALGLPDEYLICKPNEIEGRFIFSEIMQTGNFGKWETRYRGDSKLRRMTRHGAHLLAHYPSEVVWTPIWLIFHKIWRKVHLRKIEKLIEENKTN